MDTRYWDPFAHIVKSELVRVGDCGPLHGPITSFEVRRDDKLQLILETRTGQGATSRALKYPSGTVRLNSEIVSLSNGLGLDVEMSGVLPLSYATSRNHALGSYDFTEISRVHAIEARLPNTKDVVYTVEWLENCRDFGMVWPHCVRYEPSKAGARRSIIPEADGLTIRGPDEREGFSRHCIRFQAAGHDMYLCAAWTNAADGCVGPGCLIYLGQPSDEARSRIRNSLSFSLGLYLVHLGTTAFSADWEILSFKSLSPYTIDRKVFELPAQLPAPLGSRWQSEVSAALLSRMVNALYDHYDKLEFEDLGWAYWHAKCATPHISPVHFGAAIEAVQRAYMSEKPHLFSQKIVDDRKAWRAFASAVEKAAETLPVDDVGRACVLDNISGLNRIPHRKLMMKLHDQLRIRLSDAEDLAWRRRNDAAHGAAMKPGSELEIIQDMKLLRGIFTRLVLRITGASDSYIDYASPNFPVRRLEDPPQ